MARKDVKGVVTIEDARLLFRNFEGRTDKYNPNGLRSFGVIIDDPEVVHQLESDGWNVKYLKPREGDEESPPTAWLSVKVRYPDPGSNAPKPKIVLINKDGAKTLIGESEIKMLDWADFEKVDVAIRPYNWSVGEKGGVAGYLKTFYGVTIADEFEDKYDDWAFDDGLPNEEWSDED